LDAIQFYNPPPQSSSISRKCTTSQYINRSATIPPRRKEGGHVHKSYCEIQYAGGNDGDGTFNEDYFPTIDELLHSTSRKANLADGIGSQGMRNNNAAV
jgi:hypothetical protein